MEQDTKKLLIIGAGFATAFLILLHRDKLFEQVVKTGEQVIETGKKVGKKVRGFVFDKLIEAKISLLNKRAQPVFREFIKRVQDNGFQVIITSGYRDASRQAELRKGKGSFAVKPGNSYHNYGFAIDINAIKDGEQLKLSSGKEKWEKSGIPAIGRELGLRWGGDFIGREKGDYVHFDYPILPMPQIKELAALQFGKDVLTWKGNELTV